ncbi:predicted protein [Naegleria gruberi]|uniref:Predicted protein n=1 Tax=Naegleria gruberi TaxID=5762 RepID=D2W031_NAEGR|nr:uncharacterized protein NAEGRDRAFT_53637 [Naegleria gruberi]EFC37545.1 predicted protein [Naegleria gruberi]|eukprot:XP_002670289.1 predicted protein [Naegleria gruberi strain NEG-M]
MSEQGKQTDCCCRVDDDGCGSSIGGDDNIMDNVQATTININNIILECASGSTSTPTSCNILHAIQQQQQQDLVSSLSSSSYGRTNILIEVQQEEEQQNPLTSSSPTGSDLMFGFSVEPLSSSTPIQSGMVDVYTRRRNVSSPLTIQSSRDEPTTPNTNKFNNNSNNNQSMNGQQEIMFRVGSPQSPVSVGPLLIEKVASPSLFAPSTLTPRSNPSSDETSDFTKRLISKYKDEVGELTFFINGMLDVLDLNQKKLEKDNKSIKKLLERASIEEHKNRSVMNSVPELVAFIDACDGSIISANTSFESKIARKAKNSSQIYNIVQYLQEKLPFKDLLQKFDELLISETRWETNLLSSLSTPVPVSINITKSKVSNSCGKPVDTYVLVMKITEQKKDIRTALTRRRTVDEARNIEEFENMFNNPTLLSLFRIFLEKEKSAENLAFLEEVRAYKSTSTTIDRGKKQQEIISKYLEKSSNTFLNISHAVYETEESIGKKKKNQSVGSKRLYCLVELFASLPHQQQQQQQQDNPCEQHEVPLSKPIKISICPTLVSTNNDDCASSPSSFAGNYDEMKILSLTIDSTLTFNLNHVHNCQNLSIRVSIMESKFFSKDSLLGCGQIQVPNTITPNMETVLSTTLRRKDKLAGTLYSALTLLRRCVSGSFPMVSPYKSRMNTMDTRCKTMNSSNSHFQSLVNSSLSIISNTAATTNPYSMVEIVDEESGIIFNISENYEKCVQEFVQSNQFCETISTFLFKNIQLKDRRGNFIDTELDQIKLQLFADCEQSLELSNRNLIHKMIHQDQIGAFLNFESAETMNSVGVQQIPNFVENFRDRKVEKLQDSQALSNEWIFYNQSLNRRVKVEVLVLCMEEVNSLVALEHRTTLDETSCTYSKASQHSIIEEIASSIHLLGSQRKRSTIDNSHLLGFQQDLE